MRRYFALPLLLAVFSASAAEWNFSLTPYIWGIDTELNTKVDQISVETEFQDLVENLDFAAQLHFEALHGNWGLMADVTNLQVSDRTTYDIAQIDTDTEVWLGEIAGLWAIGNEETTRIDLIFGMRVLSLDMKLELQALPPAPALVSQHSISETMIDGLVGLRHYQKLGKNWSLIGRGDVATGDTNLTWNASLVVGRKLGPGVIQLSYRYMNIQFNKSDRLEPELIIQGPELGYSFQF